MYSKSVYFPNAVSTSNIFDAITCLTQQIVVAVFFIKAAGLYERAVESLALTFA